MLDQIYFIFLAGCLFCQSFGFRTAQVDPDDIQALIQDEVEQDRRSLVRLHHDVVMDENTKHPDMDTDTDDELTLNARPHQDELPTDIMPLEAKSEDQNDMSTGKDSNDMTPDEGPVMADRKKRPRPRPEELPIAIKPLKSNMNGGVLQDRVTPVDDIQGTTPWELVMGNRKKKRPRPSPDELPIAIKPLNAKAHKGVSRRVPILNIQHKFKFPVFDVSTAGNKDLRVIEEEPGVPMDTRPLSLRESPNPVRGERKATICGGNFYGLSGIINSPDYPFNYPDNTRCVYKIILEPGYTVGLDCNDFSIQPGDNDCENDFLAVSDNGGEVEPTTKYCGDKAISAFSQSSNMTIVFQTDSAYRYRGFMCRYRALNPDGTGAEGIVHVNSTAAEHTVICTGPGDDGWAGKCGVSNIVSSRIVGGHNIQEHQFPWMVAVLKECGKEYEHYCHICGGTVIHSQWILTGAHCLVSVHVETIALLLGDHNLYTLTPSQKFFRVEAVYVHPDFNVPSPLNNDVALAKLPQNMAFTKYISPICMPPRSYLDLLNLLPRRIDSDYETTTSFYPTARKVRQADTTEVPVSHKVIHDNLNGRNVSIFGWGTINDDADVSQTLRGVSVSVLPNAECDYYYGVMTDTMMCTSGDGGHGPCQGDSGSPAQMQMVDGRWIQVGVLAFGAAYGCEVGYPSGNVLLPVFIDWIEFVTGMDFSEYY